MITLKLNRIEQALILERMNGAFMDGPQWKADAACRLYDKVNLAVELQPRRARRTFHPATDAMHNGKGNAMK